jgi:hypothetical protein
MRTLDAAPRQRPAAARVVVALVGVQLGGALAPPPGGRLGRRDRVDQRLEDDGVVAVGAAEERGEGDAGPVDHKVALRARLAAVRWVRVPR